MVGKKCVFACCKFWSIFSLCSALHFNNLLDTSSSFEEDNDYFEPAPAVDDLGDVQKAPTVQYEWSYVNFTWPTIFSYENAIKSRKYIPENVLIGGIRFFREHMYMSLPKYRTGVPATLTVMPKNPETSKNNLLTPFPNWRLNDDISCDNLQNVLGIEIDRKGILWALDGVRINNMNTQCPPKLILLDLNNGGIIMHSYTFPSEICLQDGGFLNDLVLDETDGTFAYITDNSNSDPGLIVYSKSKNKSWKFRDSSMFADIKKSRFVIDDAVISTPLPIDGIALSPYSLSGRTLYYSSVSGVNLYAISTAVVKSEDLVSRGIWRYAVDLVGKKQGHTDGMMMDTKRHLYYTLIDLYGIGGWNSRKDFDSSAVIYTNRSTVIWSDGIAMDQDGYLYFSATAAYRYIFPSFELLFTPDIKFRIFKMYTGSKSYLY